MKRLVFTFALVLSGHATAQQIDPSSALLLNQGSRASTRDSGIGSGRYETRPRKTDTSAKTEEKKRRSSPSVEEARPIAQEESGTGEDTVQPTIVTNPTSGSFHTGPAPLPPPPPLSQVVLGGTGSDIEQYRQVLSVDDRRLNLLEISLAPSLMYNDSKSSYAFRDYVTVGPGFHAEARVWFSPFFGIQTSYAATLSGHVSDSFTSSRSVAATHSWLRAGIRSRRFLTAGRTAPALTFGIDYFEYQLRIPGDAQARGRIRTSGPSLVLESDWPTSNRYSWLLGVSFLPKAQHKESATSLDLRSGANVDTNGVGFSVGGRLQYDRSGAMFWRLSQTIEKNLFSGTAGTADPITGTAPNGVPVLNTFTNFQIGYTWGN